MLNNSPCRLMLENNLKPTAIIQSNFSNQSSHSNLSLITSTYTLNLKCYYYYCLKNGRIYPINYLLCYRLINSILNMQLESLVNHSLQTKYTFYYLWCSPLQQTSRTSILLIIIIKLIRFNANHSGVDYTNCNFLWYGNEWKSY